MTFFEKTLPPGDRDAAPERNLGGSEATDARRAAAGRKPPGRGGSQDPPIARVAAIRAALDQAQEAIGELSLALTQKDGPSALAAALRLREALMLDLRYLSAELFRELAQQRRAATRREVGR